MTLSLLVGALCWARASAADTIIIRQPGSHPNYVFEAEPHVALGLLPAPGPARGFGMGVGFRGTLEIVDNGFIAGINNTVGVGVGADWVYYADSSLECQRDPASQNCAELDPDYSLSYLYLPVVMQWNFWLSRQWSVFGEPGLGLHFASRGDERLGLDPFVFAVGGRLHFSDRVTLTMRAGYPTFSVGVSFLL